MVSSPPHLLGDDPAPRRRANPGPRLARSQALTATGLIWVRYSFVITPVNYSLAAVNAFVGATGIASLYRAYE